MTTSSDTPDTQPQLTEAEICERLGRAYRAQLGLRSVLHSGTATGEELEEAQRLEQEISWLAYARPASSG